MFRKEFPRLYELRDLIPVPNAENAYFGSFDDLINNHPSVKRHYIPYERALQRLDDNAWKYLKEEALPYLTQRDLRRGWCQLFDCLNSALAYLYLLDEGCKDIQLIPRVNKKGYRTPDLKGELNGINILCEVKTINRSDKALEELQQLTVQSPTGQLEPAFFDKLGSVLQQAKKQMEIYDDGTNVRRIAFVIVTFDDYPFSVYADRYFGQIDEYLGNNSFGITILFYNLQVHLYGQVTMKNATVVNE